MERIIVHIKPINWTEGDVYGMRLRLSEPVSSVKINWGDGKSDTYFGKEIEAVHVYPKDENLSFIVAAEITGGEIEYFEPSGGDCYHEYLYFTGAPSIKEIYCEGFERVKLDNPNLSNLSLRIMLGKEYDLSNVPNLKKLIFDCENREIKKLDLTHCHKLEYLQSWCYFTPNLKLILPNDVPLKFIDIRGHDFSKGTLDAIHRIIERNGGEIVGEFEDIINDDDIISDMILKDDAKKR